MHRQGLKSFIKGVLLAQLFLVILLAGISFNLQTVHFPRLDGISLQLFALPFNRFCISDETAMKLFQNSSFLTGESTLAIMDPAYRERAFSEGLLTASIQALAYADPREDDGIVVLDEEQADDDILTPEPLDETTPTAGNANGSKIIIYCTHTAETYLPEAGRARVDGKRGLITQVAAHLSQAVSEKGWRGVYLDTIHDWPNYQESYIQSRITMKDALKKNQDVSAVFDVHRDSIPGAKTAETVNIQGNKCAPILIVVGTNERKPHPNWKKNYAFAEALYQAGQNQYPGLIKAVRTKAGTYNQENHDHALLLEFGSDLNTLAEVKMSAELFANVLQSVLIEGGSQ